MAYASLGANAFFLKDKKKDLFEEKVCKDLAAKYGKSIGQILLNWGLH